MSSELFNLTGWELLRSSALGAGQQRKEADEIIAFVHWLLVNKAQLGCVGVGSSSTNKQELSGYADSSELLPLAWNEPRRSYNLRYAMDDGGGSLGTGSVYLLLGSLTEDSIIVKMLSSAKQKLSAVHLDVADTCAILVDLHGLKRCTLPAQQLIDRLVRELINPVFESGARTAETQTVPDRVLMRNAYQQPRSVPPGRGAGYSSTASVDPRLEERSDELMARLEVVGRGDLDPLGAGGGGMLFQPPTVMPAVRPDNRRPSGVLGHRPEWDGAHFDPFGPPGMANSARPDNDHMRPPGFDEQFLD